MKFETYKQMKIALAKSKVIEYLESNKTRELSIELNFIKSLGFEVNDLIKFIYQVVCNSLQDVELNTLIYLFDKTNEHYAVNLNVNSYANLSYFYINENDSISPYKLKSFMNEEFLSECDEDFLVLFSAYYLEKLLMVNCDIGEIKRINSKLKTVMDDINSKNGR